MHQDQSSSNKKKSYFRFAGMKIFSEGYISSGCNRTPNSVDWGNNGLIAYGSCKGVAIYDPKLDERCGAVICTLSGHKARVNCVKWIGNNSVAEECELVSGSTDTTAIVWKRVDKQFERNCTLIGHTGPVNAIDTLYSETKEGARTLVVSASSDSTVKIWERKPDCGEFTCIQTLSFGNGFALDVSITLLPDSNVPILACVGDDMKVHLYTENSGQFVKGISLPGHEDWIRSCEFSQQSDGDILLATSSQDTFIRIWRLSPRQQQSTEQDNGELKLKETTISTSGKCFAVILESVLAGHEGWVYAAHWAPPVLQHGVPTQTMCLLSASMDKTMIVWRQDEESGVWLEQVRVGEVGGNTLGLYGCQFSPDGSSILGHGYQGAFHLWHQQQDNLWSPGVAVSGHFDSVEDIAWDPENGNYLLSVGLDQTTRLHAIWRHEDKVSWHEIARPQVHGYDMTCLCMINKYKFASGADEKVSRIFEAPKNFKENLDSICGIDTSKDIASHPSDLAEGASVPALGLSNKAVFSEQPQNLYEDGELQPQKNGQYGEIYFKSVALECPPTEEHLLQNTLWPETQKLYGHGFEIYSMACNPQGTVLATACKASKPEYASILLWDVSTWRQIFKLESHTLTITQLAFSHKGNQLLSVSRDRTWSLFEVPVKVSDVEECVRCIAHTDKKTSVHSRIIWSCAWSHDDCHFVTAARDKKVVMWGQTPEGTVCGYGSCGAPLDCGEAATAVDMAPCEVKNRYLVTTGLESGKILLHLWDKTSSFQLMGALDNNISHQLTVKRLKFRPVLGRAEDKDGSTESKYLQLASCGADHAVKIYDISIEHLTN
ncbi:unnamed protein product [Owenia fusiformis]|uniref:Elongator complex protein 2 n=1 Tax=Owenia fusiformis TaxID=6347 RepID=A0A8J1UM08_OWEFU|nr:unnamed protein product [Owenia fusiformis]